MATDYISLTMRLSDAVRLRLREEMAQQDVSQRDLAGMLKWSQGRVAKVLTGRVQLLVDDLEAICTVLTLRPTEAVRDRGYEFAAELTPTELRILEAFRRLPKPTADAMLHILKVQDMAREEGPKRKPRIPHGRG